MDNTMSSSRILEQRAAVVTGAGQGIGAAIARRLAAEGAHVYVTDIDRGKAERVAREINAAGGSSQPERMDISSAAEAAALAAVIQARDNRLDILVNNAGIEDSVGFPELTMEHYRKITSINLDGALIVSMALLPLIRQSAAGRIVHMSSIQGLRGWPGATSYQVAKGALVNLTRSMACDLAPFKITVNAIAPGFVDTPMCIRPDGSHEHNDPWYQEIYIKWGRIPLRRAALPEDIAGPTLFFCSDDSRYVTGQTLLVDGGVSATF